MICLTGKEPDPFLVRYQPFILDLGKAYAAQRYFQSLTALCMLLRRHTKGGEERDKGKGETGKRGNNRGEKKCERRWMGLQAKGGWKRKKR